MKNLPDDCVGAISYTGKLTEGGMIDARSASRALNGIDTALHFFASQDEPLLGAFDLPLPVRLRQGSWETLIPHDVYSWLMTAGGIAISTYLKKAAEELAKNGFKNETISSILKKGLSRIQLLIALGKHLGHLDLGKLKGIRWDTTKGKVMIPNERGEVIEVAEADMKLLMRTPPKILRELASAVDEERTLVVRVREGLAEKVETLTRREKHIFVEDDELDREVLFPEFAHDAPVQLEGIVTRENGRARTLGFFYKGHVLTCIPASGDMRPFKRNLFLQCRIVGKVTRSNKDSGLPTEKRPKIIFTHLTILSDKEQIVMDFIDDPEG